MLPESYNQHEMKINNEITKEMFEYVSVVQSYIISANVIIMIMPIQEKFLIILFFC